MRQSIIFYDIECAKEKIVDFVSGVIAGTEDGQKQAVTKKRISRNQTSRNSDYSRISDDEAAVSASYLLNSSVIDRHLSDEYDGVKIASVGEKPDVMKSPPNYELILRELNKVKGTSDIQQTVLAMQQKVERKEACSSENVDNSVCFKHYYKATAADEQLKDFNSNSNDVKLSYEYVANMIDQYNKQNPNLENIIMPAVTKSIISASTMQSSPPVTVTKSIVPIEGSESNIVMNDEHGNQVIVSVPSNTQYVTLQTDEAGAVLLAPLHSLSSPVLSPNVLKSESFVNANLPLRNNATNNINGVQSITSESEKTVTKIEENVPGTDGNDRNKSEKDVKDVVTKTDDHERELVSGICVADKKKDQILHSNVIVPQHSPEKTQTSAKIPNKDEKVDVKAHEESVMKEEIDQNMDNKDTSGDLFSDSMMKNGDGEGFEITEQEKPDAKVGVMETDAGDEKKNVESLNGDDITKSLKEKKGEGFSVVDKGNTADSKNTQEEIESATKNYTKDDNETATKNDTNDKKSETSDKNESEDAHGQKGMRQ